ncbi:MAG: hypothetical protein NC299_09425 [Lachnospiraceae bacterium]|nr:hypothetical protein [Ruminococcus sp.]MCM1275574.1 hypothetical protein [Lachnospiraceae bacterium]
MKKTPILTAALAFVLFLTACGISLIYDSSENESSSGLSSAGGGFESSTPNSSDAPREDEPSALPVDFSVADYVSGFDDVNLLPCLYISDISLMQADETAIAKAVGAYERSELYSEAMELANEMFRVENGELLENETEQMLWLKYGYRDYIVLSETNGLAFRYNIVSSVRYALDGENEESIVLLNVPLPPSRVDSSAHAGFHVPVYVNSDGEACILDNACRQDYGQFKLLACLNGNAYALFGFGHNENGQQSAVYSFKNGAPELELSGCPIALYNGMLMGGYGWNTFEPFMPDADSGEFCALAAVPPSAELAEILCSDKIIQTYVPNAREMYQDGQIQIIGGKYITFNTGMLWNDLTFVFNPEYGCFERVEPVSARGSALPEQVKKSYNVRL